MIGMLGMVFPIFLYIFYGHKSDIDYMCYRINLPMVVDAVFLNGYKLKTDGFVYKDVPKYENLLEYLRTLQQIFCLLDWK